MWRSSPSTTTTSSEFHLLACAGALLVIAAVLRAVSAMLAQQQRLIAAVCEQRAPVCSTRGADLQRALLGWTGWAGWPGSQGPGQAGRAACPSATGGPASCCGSSLPIRADQPEIGSHSWHRYVWESKADGSFAVSEDTEGEPLGRGTQINIYLKARFFFTCMSGAACNTAVPPCVLAVGKAGLVCFFIHLGGALVFCTARWQEHLAGKAGLVLGSRWRAKCNTAGFSGLRAAGVCMHVAATPARQSMPFPPSQLFVSLHAPQSQLPCSSRLMSTCWRTRIQALLSDGAQFNQSASAPSHSAGVGPGVPAGGQAARLDFLKQSNPTNWLLFTPLVPAPQESAQEYLQEDKLRGLVQRYSEFINFPILMLTSRTEEKEVGGQLPAGFVAPGVVHCVACLSPRPC